MRQELKENNVSYSGSVQERNQEKIKRFNDILFSKLSHLQHDMLTFNLEKEHIRILIKKICQNA